MAKITRKIDENTYITEDYEEGPCTFFEVIKCILLAISPLLVCGLIALWSILFNK